jgi:hypothetical protein
MSAKGSATAERAIMTMTLRARSCTCVSMIRSQNNDDRFFKSGAFTYHSVNRHGALTGIL